MSQQTILVIDGDSKNLQILQESLEKANFSIIAARDGNEAWADLQKQHIDLILSEVDVPGLDGFQLLEKLQKDPIHSTVPLVFLTNRRNLDDRIRSLRSGVKDYMIKPLHVKEVIARLQMILRRLERLKTDDTDLSNRIIGRLEDQGLDKLVERYGADRKTGVLTVYDRENHSGEIYFRDGAVINARLGNYKAEKAVYEMLPWKEGHFVMVFQDIHVKEEITVSNLGLLLQSVKHKKTEERLVARLPSLETIFVKTGVFEQLLQKKSISGDAQKFISLFDGYRTVQEILSESTYDNVTALERIIKLYDQKFIKPLEPTESTKEHEPDRISSQPDFGSPADESEIGIESYEFESDSESNVPQGYNFDLPGLDLSHFKSDTRDPEINPKTPIEHNLTNGATEENGTENDLTHALEETDDKPVQHPKQQPAFQTETNGKSTTAKPEPQTPEKNPFSELWSGLLDMEGLNRGHLAIISSDNNTRKNLMNVLTNRRCSIKAMNSQNEPLVEHGIIRVDDNRTLELMGLSTEKRYLQLLDQISQSLLGYILLISTNRASNLEYLAYLVNSLKSAFKSPRIVAVYRAPEAKELPLDVVRHSLQLSNNEQLVSLDQIDVSSLVHLIRQFRPPLTEDNQPSELSTS